MRRIVLVGAVLVALLTAALRLPGSPPRASRGGTRDAAAAGDSGAPTAPPGDPADAGAVVTTLGTSQNPKVRYSGFKRRLDAAYKISREGLRELLGHESAAVRAVATLAILDDRHGLDEADLAAVEARLGDADWGVRFAAGLAILKPQLGTRYVVGPYHEKDAALERLEATYPIERISSLLSGAPTATRGDALRILTILWADQERCEAGGRLIAAVPGLVAPVAALLVELARSDAPELTPFAEEMLGCCGAAVADWAPHIALRDDNPIAATALLRMGRRLDQALPVLAQDLLARRAMSDNLLFLLASDQPQAKEWGPLVPLVRASLGAAGPLKAADAARVACHLGPVADACVPELVTTCGSPELAPIAICALAQIGTAAAAAAPHLLAEITSGREYLVDPWCLPAPGLEILEPVRYSVDPWPTWGSLRFETPPVSIRATVLALRAGALVAPRDRHLVSAALRRLDDPDALVREAATLFLREAIAEGDIPPTAIAARLAADADERVRRTAATVLRSAAAREAVVSCLARLLDTGDDLCREYAARALGRSLVENKPAEHALACAMESENVTTRTWAAAALLGVDFPVERAAPDVEPSRARALDILADSACAASDPALRRIAVCMLRWEPRLSRTVLVSAARDADPVVRDLAEIWLKREPGPPDDVGEPAVVPSGPAEADLIRMVVAEPLTPIDVVLDALDGDPQAVGTLPAIAADDDLLEIERWCARELLGRVGAPK